MRALVLGLIALPLIGCARYDYTTRAADGVQQSIRVDRVTGETQALSSNAGWVTLKTKPQPAVAPAKGPCSAAEVAAANQPPNEMDHYLPERIRARHRQCRTTQPGA